VPCVGGEPGGEGVAEVVEEDGGDEVGESNAIAGAEEGFLEFWPGCCWVGWGRIRVEGGYEFGDMMALEKRG